MTSAKRRDTIAARLKQSAQPLRAADLAQQLQVSRQVIVGDVALLRALGWISSRRPKAMSWPITGSRAIFCVPSPATRRTGHQAELYTIIDNGGGVVDVIVEHPIYAS
jgi:transcriptional regulator of NAD metabolism